MSDAFPPSTRTYVNATAPIVQYPPEFFNYGAAGFHHVLAVLNDLALAASSVQAAPPPTKKRRRGAPAPYSSTKDSRGHNIWRAVMVCLRLPFLIMLLAYSSLTRIAYLLRPGNASLRRILVVAIISIWTTGRPCVSINSLRPTRVTSRTKTFNTFPLVSALRAQRISGAKMSTSRADKIEGRTQSLIFVSSFFFRGQRVDIYSQKGRHFDTCAAYRALCARTNTKPEPISTNRAAVKALLMERDRLRISLGFKTQKNVHSAFPITPLPLLTPVTHALPSNGACDSSPVGRQHSPSDSTSAPSLTPSPCSSTASSRMLTPIEHANLQNSCPLPLIPNQPIDWATQGDSHGIKNLDVSFPAHFSPSHARVSEWNGVQNLATPMRPDTLSANHLCASWDPMTANSAPGHRQMADQGVLANMGTNASEDLNLHASILQEEFTVYNEQPAQVNGGGVPFLSSGEGSLELPFGVISDARCRTTRFGPAS